MPGKAQKTAGHSEAPKQHASQAANGKHPREEYDASHYIASLHRTMGNRAVHRLFASGAIQAKLTVGRPNDNYEEEADRVADAVMRMPEPRVQRECEEEPVQTRPLADRITPLLQRQSDPEEEEEEPVRAKAAEETPQVTSNLEASINALQGRGQPLSKESRAFFEPRFGRDFSGVRVHTDTRANQLARSVNARAFTRGNDLVFGSGEYSPGSAAGRRLLGHELTHTIQQAHGSASTVQYKRLSDPFPRTIPDFEGSHPLDEPIIRPLPKFDEQVEIAGFKTAIKRERPEGQANNMRPEAATERDDQTHKTERLGAEPPENLSPTASHAVNMGPINSVTESSAIDSTLQNGQEQLTHSQEFSDSVPVPEIRGMDSDTPLQSGDVPRGGTRRSGGDPGSPDATSEGGGGLDGAVDHALSGESSCPREEMDLNQPAAIQLPNHQAPDTPQTETGALSSVNTNVTRPSGRGILERAAEALLSQLTSRAASETESGKSGANSATGEATRSATAQAQNSSRSMTDSVEGVRNEAQTSLPGTASRGTTMLGAALGSAFGGIRTLLRRHAGPIRAKIRAWVASGGRTNLLAALLAPIRQEINRIVQHIRAAAQRVINLILGVARRITSMIIGVIRRLTALATRIVRAIAAALRRMIHTVRRLLNRIVSRILSFARSLGSAIAQFVSSILNAVRAAINRIINAVQRLIERVISAITAFIRRTAQLAIAFVQSVLQAVIRAVQSIVNAVRRLIEYFVCLAARAIRVIIHFITGLIRRAAMALAEAVKWLVLEWLKPRIQAALATAREMIDRIRRYGQRYVAAAREGARRAQQLGHNMLQSILKPEGDHFTIGLTGGGGVAGGEYVAASIGAGVSAVLDMHISYRHSIFAGYLTFSPLEISGGVGVGGGGGANLSGGLTYGWGSVLSYGRERNMHASVGGWQISGGVGAEIGGGALGRGSYGIGEQLSTNLGDVPEWARLAPFGHNPVTGFLPPPPGVPVTGGPGFPGTVPGTETHPPRGGTWSGVGPAAGNGQTGGRVIYIVRPTEFANRSLFFETGKNDIIFDPARISISRSMTLDDLVTETRNRTRHADLWSAQAAVSGHASPRWRHPQQGWTAADENQRLSLERAIKTRDVLENKMQAQAVFLGSRPTVSGHGAPAGEVDSDQPQQRRADIIITITKYTAQPVPQPTPNPHEPAPPPGQLPSLGWDTSVAWQLGVEAGGEATATAQLRAGISYTCPEPLWEHNLSPDESKGLRILLGLMKVTLDVAHGNPIGLVRDAAGLIGGIEEIIGVELTDPIVNFMIPMPESA